MAANNSKGSAPVSIFILRSHNSTPQTTVTRPSHTFHPDRISTPNPPPPLTLSFGWLLYYSAPPRLPHLSKTLTTVEADFWLVVVFSHLMAANNSKGSAPVSIFILRLHNSTPQTTATRPSHTFHPDRISSPNPPPPLTQSFGWLLYYSIKWRPTKAEAPPISSFSIGVILAQIWHKPPKNISIRCVVDKKWKLWECYDHV